MSQDPPPAEPIKPDLPLAEPSPWDEPEIPPMAGSPPAPEPVLPQAASPAIQSRTLRSVQRSWRQASPTWKNQIIRGLRGTIQVLESLVARLEAEPPSPMPEATSSATAKAGESVAAGTVRGKIPPLWQQGQSWWQQGLLKLRAVLPEAIHQRLSDRVLTGAIASILILLLWTTTGLLSGKPQSTPVAVRPPAAPRTAPQPPGTPRLVPTPAPSPSSAAPNPQPSVAASPAPLSKPVAAKPLLKLTPEQKLIASIQDQVAEISHQYANGLIQSVQANFRNSRLTVILGDGWYSLTSQQQEKLGNELLRRAQQLNFSRLEVTNATGSLLARSPVVGSEMVILQRQSSAG